jgi:hypothetical protein
LGKLDQNPGILLKELSENPQLEMFKTVLANYIYSVRPGKGICPTTWQHRKTNQQIESLLKRSLSIANE